MIIIKRSILLLLWMFPFSTVYSQQNILDQRINIRFDNQSIRDALKKIEDEVSGFIAYSPSELPKERRITKSFEQTKIRTIIKELWGSDELKFLSIGNKITIQVNPKNKAKNHKGNLQGKITDDDNIPIPFAAVAIKGTTKGVVANVYGIFQMQSLDEGIYTLSISSTGYQTKEITLLIRPGQTSKLFAKLPRSINKLDEVVITTKSESRRLSEQPINVLSIDTKALKSEATDAISILTRASGVRVRQSGGLGSVAEIQLNGLSGNAVRQYYNGIPLELLSGGIQLNNIPVNAIDRIDIYKGVMPVDIGTDALAGGVNVVSKEIHSSYLDASYEFGSFNTHIAAINGAKVINNKFFVGYNGFFNFSDNNYKMRNTRVARLETFKNSQGNEQTRVVEEIETVERFHDQHLSSFSEVQFGINKLGWADRMVFSVGISHRFDEIQHGIRVNTRPAGEVERDNITFFQNIQYEKKFNEKLQLKYHGNYAIVHDNRKDSTQNLYNWLGEVETDGMLSGGAELLTNPSLREGRTFVTVHRLSGKYVFFKDYKLSLSNFFAYRRITGNDPIAQRVPTENPIVDPNTLPSEIGRNILAAQLERNWSNKRLETLVFGKYYSYFNRSSDFNQRGGTIIFDPITKSDNRFGFGAGIKLPLDEDRFLRLGYESAIRIPSGREVFGDFVTIIPNFTLLPEQSNNLNVGLFYRYNFSQDHFASFQIDWFLRDQQDLIRLQVPLNPNAPAQFINQAKVKAQGIEAAIKAQPNDQLNIDMSFTFQHVKNAESLDPNKANDAGKAIPNIPQLFYNIGFRYGFNSPLNTDDQVTLFSYYNYVQEFSLIFEGSIRNDDNFIPTQNQVNAGISYQLANSGFTFSLQVNNVTNAELFDNYRTPRPGRNYRIKIRFEI